MPELIVQNRLQHALGQKGRDITVEAGRLPSFLIQANALILDGDLDQARALLTEDRVTDLQQRLRHDPSLTDVMYVWAKVLYDVGRQEESRRWLEHILEIEPHLHVLDFLAEISTTKGQVLAYRRRALALAPDDSWSRWSYATSLLMAGRVQEGVAAMQAVCEEYPEELALQYQVLVNQHFLPGYDRDYFQRHYKEWAPRYCTVEQPFVTYSNSREPQRRLKLALLSGDLANNSITTSFELIWTLLESEQFELYAYNNSIRRDEGTERWQSIMDVFREVRDLEDHEVAQLIHDDEIDILMEVGGFGLESRMPVFAYCPAPIQLDYGWFSTTGLPQIQYRISCPVLDPPESVKDYVEDTIYISPMCPYAPPPSSPLVTPLPARTRGYVTFGVVNNYLKYSATSLDLWAGVLGRVPGARLMMKFPDGQDADLAGYFVQELGRRGVEPGRIDVYGTMALMDHLALMGQCDLMLDCYPYNAARGTMEALWMGVPTVTLTGDTFVSREGLAIQSQVGLEIFSCTTPQEYVAKAVSFSTQWDHLEAIRRSLRPRMLQSSLCDPQGWTLRFQQALRRIWQTWCEEH